MRNLLLFAATVAANPVAFSTVPLLTSLSFPDHIFREIRSLELPRNESSFSEAVKSINEVGDASKLISRAGDSPIDPPPGTVWQEVAGYQWDQTHGNRVDKERVVAAWDMARALIETSINHLTTFDKDLNTAKSSDDINKPVTGRKPTQNQIKKRVRQWIALSEPAYTQYFGAHIDSVGTLRDNYQKILTGISKQDAAGRNNHPIYLTAMAEARTTDNEDQCVGKQAGEKAQAFVIQAKHMQWLADLKKQTSAPPGQMPPDDAWVMNFCEAFFTTADMTAKLDGLQEDHNKAKDICNLKNLDSTARVILHEWTHLDFTLNTNADGPPNLRRDWVGCNQAASYAVTGPKSGNQPSQFKSFTSKNADSYAWYSVYHYMNALQECKGIRWNKVQAYVAGNCATDVWPPDADKWVKNNWNGYAAGD